MRPVGICVECKNQFKNRITIDGKLRISGGRHYCWDCRPFGSPRKAASRTIKDGQKRCAVCKETFPVSNFPNNGNGRVYSYCLTCSAKYSAWRSYINKVIAVKYKGGKCNRCGYDKCLAALDFHHVDADSKLFGISAKNLSTSNVETLNELDKCELLCANCHRELHAENQNYDELIRLFGNRIEKRITSILQTGESNEYPIQP